MKRLLPLLLVSALLLCACAPRLSVRESPPAASDTSRSAPVTEVLPAPSEPAPVTETETLPAPAPAPETARTGAPETAAPTETEPVPETTETAPVTEPEPAPETTEPAPETTEPAPETLPLSERLAEMTLDEIFADEEYTAAFLAGINIREYSESTIMQYPALRQYCLDNLSFSAYDPWMVSMRSTPDSTCFSSVGYSAIWERLVVVFRDSGSGYQYFDVPQWVWYTLLNADSMGRYYNTDIKGRYTCERLR